MYRDSCEAFVLYKFRLKSKVNLGLNANLLKVVNRSVPSSAVADGKKKKDALADVVDKADGKRKKEKKEEKDDKFCKPGEGNNTTYNKIDSVTSKASEDPIFCRFIGQN